MSMVHNKGQLVPAFGGTAAKTTAIGDTEFDGYTHWVCSSDVEISYTDGGARTVLAGSVRAFTGDYSFNGVYEIEVM